MGFLANYDKLTRETTLAYQDLSTASDEKIQSLWDRYINNLHEAGIRPPLVLRHVRRAEDYIDAHKGKKLAERGPRDMVHYLASTGCRPNIT